MLDSPPSRPPLRLGWLLFTALFTGGGYLLGERQGRQQISARPTSVGARVTLSLTDGGGDAFEARAAEDGGPANADGGPPQAVGSSAPIEADAGPVRSGPQRLSLTVAGSLDETVAAADPVAGEALASVVSRSLVWWLNPTRDARPGDKLTLVYTTPSGQEPLLLALRYQSQKLGATRTAIRYQPTGAPFARYYDELGSEIEERLVESPLTDYDQVTSLLRDGRGHKGVDFKVPVGTPVLAPVDGTITKRDWKVRANGDCLALLDGRSHRELLFLHLSAISPEVRIGTRVHRGEVLGRSGNTGHTTAPHLHYQMMSPDGRVLDPFAVTPTTRRSMSGPELQAYRAALPTLLELLSAPLTK